jgi:phosphate transport system ATP-binding protein
MKNELDLTNNESISAKTGGIILKMTARNLSFYYGSNRALTDVSLNIEEKKVTALIGPSGCGKSTFLRTLNRMNETIPGTRLEGDVKLDDIDIYKEIKDVSTVRTRVGMVFQKSNPFPKSIFENVAYGLKVNGITDKDIITEAVEDTLKRAFLWDEVKCSPAASSNGFVSPAPWQYARRYY